MSPLIPTTSSSNHRRRHGGRLGRRRWFLGALDLIGSGFERVEVEDVFFDEERGRCQIAGRCWSPVIEPAAPGSRRCTYGWRRR